jgi:hypothetical protein
MPSKQPKSEGPAKRFPLNLRTTEEQRTAIERASQRSGRSMIQEVEFLLELGAQMRELTNGMLDAGDVKGFATAVRHVRTALQRSGEDPGRWLQYIHFAEIGVYHDNPLSVEKMAMVIAEDVERRYQEAAAYCEAHGIPSLGAYLKFAPGTTDEQKERARSERLDHLCFYRQKIEIEAGRAKLEHGVLKRSSDYRDKSRPGHRAAALRAAELQRVIDLPRQFEESASAED